jgi:ribonucleoside-diphosphate reductase alpha chain
MNFSDVTERYSFILARAGLRPPNVTDDEWIKHISETSASLTDKHPLFSTDAAKMVCNQLYEQTEKCFSSMIYKNSSLFQTRVIEFVRQHEEILDQLIEHNRDDFFNFLAIKTLMRSYLLKNVHKQIIETPQYMFLRVSIGIHAPDITQVIQTYNRLSTQQYTHATPTLFNSGLPNAQLASCFLVSMKDDSIEGIFDTLKHCALISKHAGGIGLHIHNIRATNSPIKGTNGFSNGIVPLLRVFNNTSQYVDQGGGKRKGSIAIYLEPWHKDIRAFLQLKQNVGSEETKARDLFYALWVPDLFMRRVRDDLDWTLMCPNQAPFLSDVHSEEFDKLYTQYENEGIGITVKARTLWNMIIDSQVETGTPYMLFKDACNQKSNQRHLGTIKSSNLCCEIVQFSSSEETAVCNLASIALPQCIKNSKFDFNKLKQLSSELVINLNKVIDLSFYPVNEAKRSNLKHRPIGIGVQGLSDVYQLLELPFESDEANELNKQIFETIYLGAVEQSVNLAKQHGPFDSYQGSPTSKGILQFDMWSDAGKNTPLFYEHEWLRIKNEMQKYGIRNSLLTCIMPTATTAGIFNNSESVEPPQSNLFTRRTSSGNFIVINKILIEKLEKLDLWNDNVRNKIIVNRGSIQNIEEIPSHIKSIFKTIWEIKQKKVIDQSRSRAPFVCQSQSLNLYFDEPNRAKISAAQLYAWNLGLKTAVYYTRTKMKSTAPTVCESCSA